VLIPLFPCVTGDAIGRGGEGSAHHPGAALCTRNYRTANQSAAFQPRACADDADGKPSSSGVDTEFGFRE
jgi:hypothetical protein